MTVMDSRCLIFEQGIGEVCLKACSLTQSRTSLRDWYHA